MSTLTFITIAVVVLFCLNSIVVVYLKHRRGIAATPIRRRKLSAVGVALYAVMVAFLIVGVAAPKLAPESSIAGLINDAGILIYVVWCIVGTTIAGVLLTLMRFSIWKSDGAV